MQIDDTSRRILARGFRVFLEDAEPSLIFLFFSY